VLAQATIDAYNEDIIAAHRVALKTLCEILAEPPDDESIPAPRRHVAAQRTKLRYQMAVALLRTRLIKDPKDKAPPRKRAGEVDVSQVTKLAARSPVLRERHDDAVVAGDGDLAGLGVDRGHRPSGHDDLADYADPTADDRQRPVLVHHQGAQ
jgi:hypothetical protein